MSPSPCSGGADSLALVLLADALGARSGRARQRAHRRSRSAARQRGRGGAGPRLARGARHRARGSGARRRRPRRRRAGASARGALRAARGVVRARRGAASPHRPSARGPGRDVPPAPGARQRARRACRRIGARCERPFAACCGRLLAVPRARLAATLDAAGQELDRGSEQSRPAFRARTAARGARQCSPPPGSMRRAWPRPRRSSAAPAPRSKAMSRHSWRAPRGVHPAGFAWLDPAALRRERSRSGPARARGGAGNNCRQSISAALRAHCAAAPGIVRRACRRADARRLRHRAAPRPGARAAARLRRWRRRSWRRPVPRPGGTGASCSICRTRPRASASAGSAARRGLGCGANSRAGPRRPAGAQCARGIVAAAICDVRPGAAAAVPASACVSARRAGWCNTDLPLKGWRRVRHCLRAAHIKPGRAWVYSCLSSGVILCIIVAKRRGSPACPGQCFGPARGEWLVCERPGTVNNFGKNLALWIIIGLLLVALFNLFQSTSTRTPAEHARLFRVRQR